MRYIAMQKSVASREPRLWVSERFLEERRVLVCWRVIS